MTPMIMPITARRAVIASLAAMNFWYMPLSPSSRKKVGKKRPSAWAIPVRPTTVKWVSGRVVVSSPQPPAALSTRGAAIRMPRVIMMPLIRSRATIESMPAATV